MLRNAFSAFEQLDLSAVQSINLELVEYDDVTNKLALEVIYSPVEEKEAATEGQGKMILDLTRGGSGL